MLCLLPGNSQHSLLIQGLNGGSIFRLTRVTRIFQKNVFTELRQEPGRMPRRVFLLRDRARGRARLVSRLCRKNREIQEIAAQGGMKACRKNREIQEIAAQGGNEGLQKKQGNTGDCRARRQ
jgi:hypothetical protein